MPKLKVLVTGGLGYIGSHTVVTLAEAGYEPVIIDNLSNSSEKIIQRLDKLTGRSLIYEIADVRSTKQLAKIIKKHRPGAIMHFAALKSVSESLQKPINYYLNNVGGTLSVLEAMRLEGITKLIFSSSATVYGDIHEPAREDMPLGDTTNPYGNTKSQCERILQDISSVYPSWSISSLRYFNPIGAHQSGLIGESPTGQPDNLMPYLTKVAAGQLKELEVYGDNYPTPDGSCIRDFIHVVDLANGHLVALKKLKPGLSVYNLGTGYGASVKQLIKTFEKVTGQHVPYRVVGRRPGDLPDITADPSKALAELGWSTKLGLESMCKDAWNWQSQNPNGY